MEKIVNALKALTEVLGVFTHFPVWYQVLTWLTVLWCLIAGGMFIHYYTVTKLKLGADSELAGLEQKALTGDGQTLMQLSFSRSSRTFEILTSIVQSNPQPEVRVSAVHALANVKDERKTAVLGQVLMTEKWVVAAACAEALGRTKDPKAAPYLVRAIDLDVDWVTSQKAAEALGFLPATDASLRALMKALNRGSYQGEAAKQSFVNLGAACMPALMANLQETTSSDGLNLTAQALAIIGDRSAIPALQGALNRIGSLTSNEPEKKDLEREIHEALATLQNR